jgi:cytochrome P450
MIHSTTAPTQIGCYQLPSHTHIVPFLYDVHTDQNNFTNPNKFDPDRFNIMNVKNAENP